MSATLRRTSLFALGFMALWALAVFFFWRNVDISDDLRKIVRAIFWFGAVVIWLVWTRPARPMNWLGLAPLSRRAVLWTAAAFALVLAWNIARVAMSGASLQMPLGIGLIWSFIGVVEEELVFRGVIQSALVSALPAFAAILISALLFLAIHIPGWLMLDIMPDPATIVSVLAIGLVCGALRHYGKSLWPAIGAHWANNIGAQL